MKAAHLAPSLGAHRELARLRGWTRARFMPVPARIRESVEATLGPGPASERLMRRSHAFSRSSRFLYVMPRLRGFRDPVRWPVCGRERLDTALAGGRGAILLKSHLGYGQAAGPILRLHGYDLLQVAAPGYLGRCRAERDRYLIDGSRLRRWVYVRTRLTGDIVEAGDVPASLDVRAIVRALERNRVVTMAGDGTLGIDYVEHTVLGRSIPFPAGYVRLSLHLGCPVLPVFAIDGSRRQPIVLEIEEPLEFDPAASPGENVALYVRRFEARLRQAPHTWHRWWMDEGFEPNQFLAGGRRGDPFRVGPRTA